MFLTSIKRYFSQAKPHINEHLSPSQLLTMQNITTTTLRNLYFLSHNLDIVFTTSVILNNDDLRVFIIPLRL